MNRPFLLLLISCTISVQAMFKPIRHVYYGGDDNCEESKTTTTTSGASTTMKWEYSCEPGWKTFQRTPSVYNDNTGILCVKFVPAPSKKNISINEAETLCKENNGELTAFENENERLEILVEAQKYMINELERSSGAIAIAGKSIAECKSMTSKLPEICSDNTKAYTLPESSKTNPQQRSVGVYLGAF
ncbi:hypothetical protein GCK72_006626 [Caenorhabditis remanei]|uniref:C-type lectin domain-containing protein n=1 Tax=Caenorhabditis remanei TaxID=31234 RepID=A0A6A5HFT2_CAERE|nr:hypothetical protein GCK72_006626 [Caenorhabditis remanei]KAF1766668.1 hypothetical protein GCK72_006626 [Caenorhabditis remanei]